MQKLREYLNNLTYNNHKIIIVLDKNINPWFKADNIILSLGYVDVRKIIRLKVKNDNKKKLKNIKQLYYSDITCVYKNKIFINVPGLYSIFITSIKVKEVKELKKWININVFSIIKKFKQHKKSYKYINNINNINLIVSKKLLYICNIIITINSSISHILSWFLKNLINIDINNTLQILYNIYNILDDINSIVLITEYTLNDLYYMLININCNIYNITNSIYTSVVNINYNIYQILICINKNLYLYNTC